MPEDDDVRMLFRRIDDGPPLGIDVQDVMADGRRARARRTGLAVAGSTLAVAAAVVVSLALTGGARSPDPLPPADPPTTSHTTPTTPNAPVSSPQTTPRTTAPDGTHPGTAPPENGTPPPGGGVPQPPATTR